MTSWSQTRSNSFSQKNKEQCIDEIQRLIQSFSLNKIIMDAQWEILIQ